MKGAGMGRVVKWNRKARVIVSTYHVNLPVMQTYYSIYHASTTQIWTYSIRKVEDLSSSRPTNRRNETGGILQVICKTLHILLSIFSFPAVPGSSPEINISDLIKSLSHVQ